jgi:site-specific DNA-methyltransferase (adenine-specific)
MINSIRKEGYYPGANLRDVWTVPTRPYPGSHYAVFPPDLIEPCILAGCPEGGIVLDPFAGSGTTLAVARKHGRHAIGLDLKFEYLNINARERMQYGSYVPVTDNVNQLTIGGLL